MKLFLLIHEDLHSYDFLRENVLAVHPLFSEIVIYKHMKSNKDLACKLAYEFLEMGVVEIPNDPQDDGVGQYTQARMVAYADAAIHFHPSISSTSNTMAKMVRAGKPSKGIYIPTIHRKY